MELTLSTVDVVHDHLWRVVRRQVDFAGPGIVLLLCGDEWELLVAATITHVASAEEFAASVSVFTEHGLGGGLVVVRTRPGRADLTPADRACCRVAHEICARDTMPLRSVHLLTPHGVRQVVLDDAR